MVTGYDRHENMLNSPVTTIFVFFIPIHAGRDGPSKEEITSRPSISPSIRYCSILQFRTTNGFCLYGVVIYLKHTKHCSGICFKLSPGNCHNNVPSPLPEDLQTALHVLHSSYVASINDRHLVC
jgi:hypothetical protein